MMEEITFAALLVLYVLVVVLTIFIEAQDRRMKRIEEMLDIYKAEAQINSAQINSMLHVIKDVCDALYREGIPAPKITLKDPEQSR